MAGAVRQQAYNRFLQVQRLDYQTALKERGKIQVGVYTANFEEMALREAGRIADGHLISANRERRQNGQGQVPDFDAAAGLPLEVRDQAWPEPIHISQARQQDKQNGDRNGREGQYDDNFLTASRHRKRP